MKKSMKSLKIKLTIIGISLLSFNIFAQDYIYKGIKNIEAKVNKSEEESNTINNVCEFSISNYESMYGFVMIKKISFNKSNNIFDFGNLLINEQNYAEFDNASIEVSTSDTRWKVSNVLNDIIYRFGTHYKYPLIVKFKKPVNLKNQ